MSTIPPRDPRWTLLSARFDANDRIPVADERARRFEVDRAELRDAVARGVPVHSVTGSLLTLEHVDAGRLL